MILILPSNICGRFNELSTHKKSESGPFWGSIQSENISIAQPLGNRMLLCFGLYSRCPWLFPSTKETWVLFLQSWDTKVISLQNTLVSFRPCGVLLCPFSPHRVGFHASCPGTQPFLLPRSSKKIWTWRGSNRFGIDSFGNNHDLELLPLKHLGNWGPNLRKNYLPWVPLQLGPHNCKTMTDVRPGKVQYEQWHGAGNQLCKIHWLYAHPAWSIQRRCV